MKKRISLAFASLFISLGLASCANNGSAPYIGENGNWWVGDNDLGVSATGEKGESGSSISIDSVVKTKSEGLVDTYTIYFSDGTTSSFTVTNGDANPIVSIKPTVNYSTSRADFQ